MATKSACCGDCAVEPGQLHRDGCDVARCARTGQQRLQCNHDDCNTTWTGQWPGEAECIEYGWYSFWDQNRGWVRCAAGEPGAGPDLNRLAMEARWDPTAQRYVKTT